MLSSSVSGKTTLSALLLSALAACTILALCRQPSTSIDSSVILNHLHDISTDSNRSQNRSRGFHWATIAPRKRLEWQDCLQGRQCARLIVPLNHSDPKGDQAIIALIRKPATTLSSSPLYRGPVLFNPGGPGGSGVDLVGGRTGDLFGQILGPHFDIVGFDPRGIGRSTPRAEIFKSNARRAIWAEGDGVIGVSNDTQQGIGRAWARAQLLGQLASENDDGYLRHINTDQTARDMLRIVEAHGRSKLQYWGFSYGSVLGATFAAMFPDKVERMVIDGVVDSENYYATLWSNNLMDTDKVLDAFFTGCAEAGPDGCPFWAPTANAISKNLTTLYHEVQRQPFPVRTENGYGLVDYTMLRTAVFATLYSPYANFPWLARALAELAAGDGRTIFEGLRGGTFDCACDDPVNIFEVVGDAQAAVVCNDGADVPSDFQSTIDYFDMMRKKSEWADTWSHIRLRCLGWPRFKKDHFQGPFEGNTSHPILLIGNTADPVTPLWAAKKMSLGFPGSIVLTQDSPGHCSLAAPSLCTLKYIQEYFSNGTLPNPDTICQPNGKPFPEAVPEVQDGKQATSKVPLSASEGELLTTARELSRGYRPPFPISPL